MRNVSKKSFNSKVLLGAWYGLVMCLQDSGAVCGASVFFSHRRAGCGFSTWSRQSARLPFCLQRDARVLLLSLSLDVESVNQDTMPFFELCLVNSTALPGQLFMCSTVHNDISETLPSTRNDSLAGLLNWSLAWSLSHYQVAQVSQVSHIQW